MTNIASPTLQRLDDQIDWYDRKSVHARTWSKWMKIVQLATAGVMPLVGIFNAPYLDKLTRFLVLSF